MTLPAYVVVPVEPTEEMIHQAVMGAVRENGGMEIDIAVMWRAMCAAAPPSPLNEESMSRAMAICDEYKPDEINGYGRPRWHEYRPKARAILALLYGVKEEQCRREKAEALIRAVECLDAIDPDLKDVLRSIVNRLEEL